MPWEPLAATNDGTWLSGPPTPEYGRFIPIANKQTKAGVATSAIFRNFSLGANTNRDAWVYAFDRERARAESVPANRNLQFGGQEVAASDKTKDLDSFLISDPKLIQWSSRLEGVLSCKQTGCVRSMGTSDQRLYRPFTAESTLFRRHPHSISARSTSGIPSHSGNRTRKPLCYAPQVQAAERPFRIA